MTGRRSSGLPLVAYLLHRYAWSESSVILELFTREYGRVVAIAKGAKRPYSQLRSVLLPLQRVTVSFGRPPAGDESAHEIHHLRSADYGGGVPMPGGAAVFAGLYLNELLLRLLARDDPHPRLFDAYADSVQALGAGDDAAVQAALRAFELMLLRETGLLPELATETTTQQPLVPARIYTLSPEAGLVAAGGAGVGLSGAAWQALHAAIGQGSELAALRDACSDHLVALRAVLRGLLHYHLGASQLRTRQVMQDMQRLLE
jgi:DNA repair protein RecO (recombination protein O)